ncbi:DUF6226 family protein [Pseudonocardia alni]|uniref:DUF6226 family protein n=1 Tax=Pseudonocardia alni TaxID=33907 RepID=UPI001AD77017|nr:DUF6226 family protein [Pseudonocardia alni]MBO4239630.1 hypothetical protein [Pseudonocardia alni]
MDTYRRPDVPAAVFHDATGAVVPHGSRRVPDGPPEDSCSVVTHSERFRPLHTVAAVVAGTFREWCTRRDGVTWVGHALGPHRGRSSSGETVAGTTSDGRGATACAGPGDDPVVWAPWPLRHA